MIYNIFLSTIETLYMVLMSTLIAVLLGLPLGTWVYVTESLRPNRSIHRLLSATINIVRSIPFIILLVLLIPFTRLIVGTSIGIHAAIIPLSIGAIPFFARLVCNIYQTLPEGLIETGHALGASNTQMIRSILLPEAFPALLQAITITAVALVNYSAMAGAVGGGGLGDLAIRYGYQRFDLPVMLATVCILVIIVQALQHLGDRLVLYFSHETRRKNAHS